MGIKLIKKIKSKILINRFINTKLSKLIHFNLDDHCINDSNMIDIYTIAFNNAHVIEHQIKHLKNNLEDKFNHIIIDNSSDELKSKKIQKLCKESLIAYVRLPFNFWSNCDPSKSHGMAMNWAYHMLVKKRKTRYFGFIDHDIFLVKPTSLLSILRSCDIYGTKQVRSGKWYIWAGFCFFNFSILEDKRIDFIPFPGLDTGGANWYSVYSKINKDNVKIASLKIVKIRNGNNHQSDNIEFIDEIWLHTINASHWKEVEDKEDMIDKLLLQDWEITNIL